jgi:hypothetical protein
VQLASIAGLGLTSLVLQLLGWLGYLGLGVFVVGAFRARYYFPKQQLLIGVIAAAASLVVGGFGMRVSSGMGGGMIDRPGLIWQLQATRDDVKWDQSQIALLDIGIQTYGKAGLPSSVPSVLMSQGRYIVPVVNGQVASLYSTHAHYSPFKAVPSAYEIRPNVAMSDLTRPLYDAPIQTAPTAAAAAIAWRENAAVTLDESQAILGRDTSVLRTYQSYNASAGFDAQAGQGELMQRLAFACAAVLLGLIASAFGRLVFRLRASPRVETSHA